MAQGGGNSNPNSGSEAPGEGAAGQQYQSLLQQMNFRENNGSGEVIIPEATNLQGKSHKILLLKSLKTIP